MQRTSLSLGSGIKAGFAGRMVLALLSSLLFTLSLPEYDQGWLAWFTLVPLILACRGQKVRRSFILGFISGAAAYLTAFSWLFEVATFRWHHALVGFSYLALYPAFWCVFLSWGRTRSFLRLLAVAAFWICLDYLRAHAGFLSWSWVSLAHTQHSNLPLLQLAAWTGAYGITFVLVVVNLAVAEAIYGTRFRQLAVIVAALVLLHIAGLKILAGFPQGDSVSVAIVQPNIAGDERQAEEGRKRVLARLEHLTLKSAESRPELIVWPETAIPDPHQDPELQKWLRRLAIACRAPILTGASQVEKFSRTISESDHDRRFEQKRYNSAYFIPADESLPVDSPYQKNILVPFAEYTPWREHLDWPGWLVPLPNQITPGKHYRHYALASGPLVSPIICWEIIFADYVRQLATEKPDIIILLANDRWFGRTAAARQHNLSSVLRAVENRMPIVVASNTGPSQFIAPTGQVVASISHVFASGQVSAVMHSANHPSFYTSNGDIFLFFCVFLCLAGELYRLASEGRHGAIFARLPPHFGRRLRRAWISGGFQLLTGAASAREESERR